MRHGRPDLPRNPFFMDRPQFNDFLEAYDRAGLSAQESQRLRRLYAPFPQPDLVLSSDLARAQETALLFARGAEVIALPILREIPLQLPETPSAFLTRRWPPEMWWTYLRLTWFRDAKPEGRTQTTKRAAGAIAAITSYQARCASLAIVSHAGFLSV
ncbi:MAG: histidine phosphatase family protein, partial [Firmicutes bacterium]|nr:histidine phosphatase family protein [Bacillota bacterium]